MEIIKAINQNELKKIDIFFGNIWKDLFEINAFNQIENYKKCDIYFIEDNSEIISAIVYTNYQGKNYIWRFATDEKYRGKGLGNKLMNHVIEKHPGEINLDSDDKQINFYKKFGFKETGIIKEIGNGISIGMIKK